MSYKLQAVNQCLRAIGESRVNSLSSGVPDAETAASVLDEVSEEVLATGWHCNSDFDIKLVPDVSNEIPVADDVLQIDTVYPTDHLNVTVRDDPNGGGKKLFDIDKQSFKFDGDVFVDRVINIEFEALPFHLRRFISATAAVRFQQQSMASVSLDDFTRQELARATVHLEDIEGELEDANILTGSYFMRAITNRNNVLSGR